jgi:hypothetical protein
VRGRGPRQETELHGCRIRLPIDRVLERAHDHVYKGFETHAALVKELTHALGRPTVARLTGVPDLKTVTRWSLGRNQPSDDRLELLRNAAVFYFALLELGLTPTNAEQWFRGANPALGFEMPVDVLHQRRYAEVAAASTNSGGSAITPNPLSVSIEYQGDGRFDDPQRERTVLYGSDAVEPCIIEIAMPWYLHSDASYVQRMEAPERDIASELLQAEFDDAERDHAIATKPAQMPQCTS